MLFIVDGYNVTRSDPATRDASLGEQRDELTRRLAARSASMLGAGPVVVVFDGAQGVGESRQRFGQVEVRYARQGTADDAIVAAVKSANERVVLVTDDVDLARRAEVHARHGIEVRSRTCCFDSAGKGGSRKGKRPAPPRDAGLPKGANKITKELKDLWLSDEE